MLQLREERPSSGKLLGRAPKDQTGPGAQTLYWNGRISAFGRDHHGSDGGANVTNTRERAERAPTAEIGEAARAAELLSEKLKKLTKLKWEKIFPYPDKTSPL